MKAATVIWYNMVPEKQRQCVHGYLRELRELCSLNASYYNVPPQVIVYCALYQWEVREKLRTFGNPNVRLNQNQNEAKFTISGSGMANSVYGSILIDPNLQAIYCWKVLIFCETWENIAMNPNSSCAEQLGIGFIGQPTESFIPLKQHPYHFDIDAKSCCIYLPSGVVEGADERGCREWSASGLWPYSWESGSKFMIFVDTKDKVIKWLRCGYDDLLGPDVLKWDAMNFDGRDRKFMYGDEDDDLKGKVSSCDDNKEEEERLDCLQMDKREDPGAYFEQLQLNRSVDWLTPMRLAVSMPGNGWLKIQSFTLYLEDDIWQ